MPQFTLPYPTGLDWYIQKLQGRLYNYFKIYWNVADDTRWNCFVRGYRNYSEDEKGYILEFFNPNDTNTTNNYVGSSGVNSGAVFYDDNFDIVSVFALGDPEKKNDIRDDVANVRLLFFMNLANLTPGGIPLDQQGGQRLDEVVVNDVKNFMLCNGCGFTITNTYRDIDKVLQDYSGSVKKLALLDNMHPKFCFRLDLTIPYNPFQNVSKYSKN